MRLKFGPLDFTQPSTWRGLLGLLALGGVALSPELIDQIAIAFAAAMSAIELFRDEYRTKAITGPVSPHGNSSGYWCYPVARALRISISNRRF